MAYPPTPPPATRLNTTPQVTNHPSDHNLISENVTDIVNELGANPSGEFTDVTARLQALMPVGSLIDYAGTSEPEGFFFCDGAAKDTTAEAALFAVIGYTYGGTGSSFNVPDFSDASSVAPGPTVGTTIGILTGNIDVQAHVHTSARHDHGITHTHLAGSLIINTAQIWGANEGFLGTGNAGNPDFRVDIGSPGEYNFSEWQPSLGVSGSTDTSSSQLSSERTPDDTGETGTGTNNYHPVIVVNKIIKN